jgi:lipopolysaccharide assembly outer membrane protein LptD (OstA)
VNETTAVSILNGGPKAHTVISKMNNTAKRKWFRIIIAAVALAATLAPLSAIISAQQPAPKQPAKDPDYKDVEIKADLLKRRWGSEKTVLLSGNVVIKQGDTVLKSDKVEYDETTQIAKSPGVLTISDPENDIRGDSGVAYLKERRGVLTGNIKLVAKPRQKAQTYDKKPAELRDAATMTCDTLEYLYKQKQATASGNLKIVQKDRTVTAEKAIYNVKDEIVTLTGNVKGSDEKGQNFSSGGKVTVSIKDGDEWMEMEQAAGTFKVKSEEEESSVPAKTPEKKP